MGYVNTDADGAMVGCDTVGKVPRSGLTYVGCKLRRREDPVELTLTAGDAL